MQVSEALAQMLEEPSPCDDCPNFSRCATEEIACKDFIDYLPWGNCKNKDRNPSKELFIRAYYNRDEVELTDDDVALIKKIYSIRGMTHRKVAEKFDVIPRLIFLICKGEVGL